MIIVLQYGKLRGRNEISYGHQGCIYLRKNTVKKWLVIFSVKQSGSLK